MRSQAPNLPRPQNLAPRRVFDSFIRPDPALVKLHAGVIVPSSQFLSFGDLARKFAEPIPTRDLNSNQKARLAENWETWLGQIGLEGTQYKTAFEYTNHSDRSRERVAIETMWADEPADKRRYVEKMAIFVKHGVLVQICSVPIRNPFREKILDFVPFHIIERQYFSEVTNGTSQSPIISQRHAWLGNIAVVEAQREPYPMSLGAIPKLDKLYADLSPLARHNVLFRAKFLKCREKPPEQSWLDFELQYQPCPETCLPNLSDYFEIKKPWLKALRLDNWSFFYHSTTQRYNEMAEVAWSDLPAEKREATRAHAQVVKDGLHPIVDSWKIVEDVLGIDSKDDGMDPAHTQVYFISNWRKMIGMGAYQTPEDLEKAWFEKPFQEKRTIIEKARPIKAAACKRLPGWKPRPLRIGDRIGG